MKLLFEDKVKVNKDAFIAKVREISKKLQIEPDWLMAAMWIESGIKADAINEIGCVGLIQFCPVTYSESWGLTQSYLANLSNVEQLDYVYKYIKAQNKAFHDGKKIKSYPDLHALIFFPKAIQFKRKQVLEYGTLTAEQVALKNSAIDLNKNLEITKKEFEKYAKTKFTSALSKNEVNRLFQRGIYDQTLQGIFVLGVIATIFGYYIYRQYH